MAAGDKKFVVMESDLAIPGGAATLDETGKLEKTQRPEYTASQICVSDETAVLLGLDPQSNPTSDDALRRIADITLPTVTVMTSAGAGIAIEKGETKIAGTADDAGIFDAHLTGLGLWRITADLGRGKKVRELNADGPGAHYTVSLLSTKVYGVRWSGGPETTWSRTDDAEGFLDPDPFVNDGKHPGRSPFDGLMPWAGMQIVDDPALGKLVSIPKYWYRWTKSGAVMTLQISDKAQPGFFVSPAHADRGDGSINGTYVPDSCTGSAADITCMLFTGGNYSPSQTCGLFFLNGSNAVSVAAAYLGCRLIKLP